MTPLEIALEQLADPLRALVERKLAAVEFGPKTWLLPRPRILLMESVRIRNVRGWLSPDRWVQGAVDLHEIVLTPEAVSHGVMVAAEVLVHELVHLANVVAKRSDTSRQGRYHNQLFRDTAEAVGLVVTRDPVDGYCLTKFGIELEGIVRELVRSKKLSVHAFKYRRRNAQKAGPSLVKLECECGVAIYMTRAAASVPCVDCRKCGTSFERANRTEDD